jgi:hypothetical protein
VGGLVGSVAGPGDSIIDSGAQVDIVAEVAGGIAGRLLDGATLDNVGVTGSITGCGGGIADSVMGSGTTIHLARVWMDVDCSSQGAGAAGLVASFIGTSNLIEESFAGGTITSPVGDKTGGLVGVMDGNALHRVFAVGSVNGGPSTGGLVGTALGTGEIIDAYATGPVSGTDDVGGLVGYADGTVTISNTYATGSVSATGAQGGLVGFGGSSTASYWNTTTTGQAADASGATGVADAGMQLEATFAGWDFTTVWVFDATESPYPLLQWQLR